MPPENVNKIQKEPVDTVCAATRNLRLMDEEISVLGKVTPELWAMILDEEQTHTAEVLAAQEKSFAAVPRTYEVVGSDLVDIHGQSLQSTLGGGILHSLAQKKERIPGADWELERRRLERANLQKIVNLPTGHVCVEISANPYDKPKNEQLEQGYNGLTMIRASFKETPRRVRQYNYALSVTNPEFLLAIQSKLGCTQSESDCDRLLKNPIIKECIGAVSSSAAELDGLIGAALLETSVGRSAVRMIKRAIAGRREAWEFVSDEANADINQELFAAMVAATSLPPEHQQEAIDAIRSGYWKEMKDRFNDRNIVATEGGIIAAAAVRAVEAGDVFVACGSSVKATSLDNNLAVGNTARAEITKSLRENIIGKGSCAACGSRGKLYGCGLCNGCNSKWCEIYERTGKQTDIKNLSYLNYGRNNKSVIEMLFDTLSESFKKIDAEVAAKRKAKASKSLSSAR